MLEREKPYTSDTELEQILRQLKANIKVVGIGGSGCNTINRIMQEGIFGAELIAINTDAQHLLSIKSHRKLIIGRRTTRGLGAGSLPQLGEMAARESTDQIREMLEGADMVFITCGLGGGTGTGASPIVAQVSKELGALTVAVVTFPFRAEGRFRKQNAMWGIEKLRQAADTVITVSNDKLVEIVPGHPLDEAFKVADEVLTKSVKGITEMITKPGLINLDFADLRTVMLNGGVAMIGLGEAQGQNRALEAVNKALSSPFIEVDISEAKAALINVAGGPQMKLVEAEAVVEEVHSRISPEAKIIWGAQIEPSLGNYIRALLVITGVKSPQIFGRLEDWGSICDLDMIR